MSKQHIYKVDTRSTYRVYSIGIADDFSYMQKPDGMDRDWLFNCLLAAWRGSSWEGDIRGSGCAGVFFSGLIPDDGYVQSFQEPVLVFKQDNNGSTYAVTRCMQNIAEPGVTARTVTNKDSMSIETAFSIQRVAEGLYSGRYSWDESASYEKAAKMRLVELKDIARAYGVPEERLSTMKGPRGKRAVLDELYSVGHIDYYPHKD